MHGAFFSKIVRRFFRVLESALPVAVFPIMSQGIDLIPLIAYREQPEGQKLQFSSSKKRTLVLMICELIISYKNFSRP